MTKLLNEEPTYFGHRKRVKDRFRLGRGGDMADYEFLEYMLFYVLPRKDTKPLAKVLVKEFGSYSAVVNADMEKVMKVEGVTESVALFLQALRVSNLKMSWQRLESRKEDVLASMDSLIDYARSAIGDKEIEMFLVIFLGVKNNVIAEEIMQKGTVDCVAIHPAEVARMAILKGAKSVVMVHNHPSGDPTPSSADIEMTKRVKEALKAIDVRLLEHIIFAKSKMYSFLEHNLIRW